MFEVLSSNCDDIFKCFYQIMWLQYTVFTRGRSVNRLGGSLPQDPRPVESHCLPSEYLERIHSLFLSQAIGLKPMTVTKPIHISLDSLHVHFLCISRRTTSRQYWAVYFSYSSFTISKNNIVHKYLQHTTSEPSCSKMPNQSSHIPLILGKPMRSSKGHLQGTETTQTVETMVPYKVSIQT